MALLLKTLTLTLALALTACSKDDSSSNAVIPAVGRFDPASIARGAELYTQHCAQCHGPQAQGHPDWQTPSDGSFAAAPPLNGTGNDWKRSRGELVTAIKDGVVRKDGVLVMPSWKQRLSERDIDDIIAWFQSQWPPPVYESWYKANLGASKS
jgi:mono/diheme cytochrome c family protein